MYQNIISVAHLTGLSREGKRGQLFNASRVCRTSVLKQILTPYKKGAAPVLKWPKIRLYYLRLNYTREITSLYKKLEFLKSCFFFPGYRS